MFSLLLCGVSAAAITAVVGGVPETWSDLVGTPAWNTSIGPNINRTFFVHYVPPAASRVAAFNKIRASFATRGANTCTVSKVYVGEASADRAGFVFQSPPVQLTFGGAPGFSLAELSSIQSDAVNFQFSGAFPLVIAFTLTAFTGQFNSVDSVPELSWITGEVVGDAFPDPASTTMIGVASLGVFLVTDVDVVYKHWLPVNRIQASQQATHIVKEGSAPVGVGIKAVNQSFYAAKEGSAPVGVGIKAVNQSFYVVKG